MSTSFAHRTQATTYPTLNGLPLSFGPRFNRNGAALGPLVGRRIAAGLVAPGGPQHVGVDHAGFSGIAAMPVGSS